MIAVIFGIQGVGKSSVVKGAAANFVGKDSINYINWGDKIFKAAENKNIIRVGDYREQTDFKVKIDDVNEGLTIIQNDKGEELIYVKDAANIAIARDDLRKLETETQKMLQEEVSRMCLEDVSSNPNGNFIIETHAALKTPFGYLPGFTEEFLKEIKPDVYIIVEASAEEILARRMADKNRIRNHDKSLAEVQINLDMTRYFTGIFAVNTHSPMCIVENKEGSTDSAIKELTRIFKNFI